MSEALRRKVLLRPKSGWGRCDEYMAVLHRPLRSLARHWPRRKKGNHGRTLTNYERALRLLIGMYQTGALVDKCR